MFPILNPPPSDGMLFHVRIYNLHDDIGKVKQFRILIRAYTKTCTFIYS